jgi:rubrerythrin
MSKTVKGTKTEESLKAAFAGESKANRRYLSVMLAGKSSSRRRPTALYE